MHLGWQAFCSHRCRAQLPPLRRAGPCPEGPPKAPCAWLQWPRAMQEDAGVREEAALPGHPCWLAAGVEGPVPGARQGGMKPLEPPGCRWKAEGPCPVPSPTCWEQAHQQAWQRPHPQAQPPRATSCPSHREPFGEGPASALGTRWPGWSSLRRSHIPLEKQKGGDGYRPQG